jgi:hypothetical protein
MKGEAVNKSGVSLLLSVFMYGCLMFTMLYADRHLSNSVADRRLHLTRSLRKANMPAEQVSALVDAVDDVGRDANTILMTIFFPLGGLAAIAVGDIYDLHRRLKRLESKPQQSLPDLQTDGG